MPPKKRILNNGRRPHRLLAALALLAGSPARPAAAQDVGLLFGLSADTTPFMVAIRFGATDSTPVFERPLGPTLLIRVRREPPFGWRVTVVPRSTELDWPNLLYHSGTWHGPYPTEVFAWSHQRQYFPDERLLPVYGHPYELRIRLIDCRTSGSGEGVVFDAGTIEVSWRPAPIRRAGGDGP